MKPKVAIACQGGGSQTAFTAGVLKALFENKVQEYFKIVSLSGTSGGAICAFFIWYALKKGDDIVWKRALDFWEDKSAQTYQERFFNDFMIKISSQYNPMIFSSVAMNSKGMFPYFKVSLKSSISIICLPKEPLRRSFWQRSISENR